MELWPLIERADGFVGLLAVAGLWFHMQKCDKRSTKVWERFDELQGNISSVAQDVSYIKGKVDTT